MWQAQDAEEVSFNLSSNAGKQQQQQQQQQQQCPCSKASQAEGILLLCFFVLIRPLTDWIRVTYIRQGNLLYSVYRSNVNLIQNNVWPNIWAPRSPVKLTPKIKVVPKINHHKKILSTNESIFTSFQLFTSDRMYRDLNESIHINHQWNAGAYSCQGLWLHFI